MLSLFTAMLIAVLGLLALAAGARMIFRSPRDEVGPGMSSAQLDRLESALGVLESRMDDLQDQQRFLERLVAERPERASLTAPESTETTASDGETDTGSILLDREARDG